MSRLLTETLPLTRKGMREPSWKFTHFEQAREKWIRAYQPSLSDVARLRDWKKSVEEIGFPPGTVFWDDEDFVVRVPRSRICVSGIAVVYEYLLVVHEIRTLGLVPPSR